MTCRYFIVAIAVTVVAAGWPNRARAATMIDGGNVGGQVWTPAGSPYLVRGVNGNLLVPAGQELRIEAGTVVSFSNGYGVVTLGVEGTLNVNGTATAPVILQGDTDGPMDWYGISPTETGVVRITGASIRNAFHGVYLTKQADVRVDRTTFEDCRTGISVATGTFAFDSIVARNNSVGIECSPSGFVTVTNALVQGNTNHGLIAQGGGSLTVINSTVDGNISGVSAWTGQRPGTVDIDNTILSNNPGPSTTTP